MIVGDVAGHDPSAAVAMGQVRSASRALAGQVRTPAELVDLMRSSWELMGIDRMATVLYGRLDVSSGDLMLASAGHPPPILVSGGRAEVIRLEPAPPLGVPGATPIPLPLPLPLAHPARAWAPVQASRGGAVGWNGRLSPGEVLLLYTDGLVERRNRPDAGGNRRTQRACRSGLEREPRGALRGHHLPARRRAREVRRRRPAGCEHRGVDRQFFDCLRFLRHC